MLRRSIVSLALAASAAAGCAGTVASEPPATADAATTKAPIAVAAHGPVRLFGEALGDVPLTATQRTAIEQLATDAEARHTPVREARQELLMTLAAQVEAGAVDRAALQPKLGAVAASISASQPADRAAFEQLHAVLTPAQRATFVDAVQAHAQENMAAMKEQDPIKRWAADLQLSGDQRAQLEAAIAQRVQEHKRDDRADLRVGRHPGQEVMAAFRLDTFVLDEVAPPRDALREVTHASGHLIGFAELAVPLLTPAQRALAAQKIRERAASTRVEGAELL